MFNNDAEIKTSYLTYGSNLKTLQDHEPSSYNISNTLFYRHLLLLIMDDIDPEKFRQSCKKSIAFCLDHI